MMKLVDFTVGNFGPFRDDVTLSMEAVRSDEHRENIIDSEERSDLLSSALIFGANASGKTFLLKAISALKSVVTEAHEDGYTFQWYQPFMLSKASLSNPVRLRIRMRIEGILFEYSVSFYSDFIASESLYHYPNGRRALVFDRRGPTGEYKKAKRKITELTSSSSSYLVVASIYNDELCNKVRGCILSDLVVLDRDMISLRQETSRLSSDDSMKKRILKALYIADFGITDYSLVSSNLKSRFSDYLNEDFLENMSADLDFENSFQVYMRHDFREADVGPDGVVFPMYLESSGTQHMYELMGPLVKILLEGKIVIMDELGDGLHPMLTRWIVEQFRNDVNPNGAQLIVTTHDVGLMDIDSLLRRDQIWFVNKNRGNGASDLYCLSDFDGVRKNMNVLRAYLTGRFDAIPDILPRGVME